MTPELGHYALVLALALSLVGGTVPFWGARTGDARLMSVAESTALATFGLVALAFMALVAAYVQSDFSVLNVFQNSHSAKPLAYKISGTWGNHEGSILLWVLILALFAALVALFGGNLPLQLRADVLSVQAWVATAFLTFILATSNPFTRLAPAPFEGQGLNPVLQDPGLAIHPPLLYLGYVGLSIAFAFAVAALVEGRTDAAWARWVRPWTLAAWTFLTLGIAMGSYWAYYELGWGGFWFWDPVENASLMPWLAATALLHSAVVMEKRGALKVWTVLLAILAFSLSLLGTFLVRSGVLTSVHAFATDPSRGVFILAILTAFIGGALALFAWRAPLIRPGGLFAPVSREGALVLNNLFLTTVCGTVLIGTLYPLALEAVTGDKISVGAPYFNRVFGLLILPVLLAVPFGPLLAWKRADLLGAGQRLLAAAAIAIAVMAFAAWLTADAPALAILGVGLAAWLIFGAFAEIAMRVRLFGIGWRESARRALGLPRSAWGTAAGHLGVGISLLGIVAASAFGTERVVSLKPGDRIDLAGYEAVFEGLQPREGPNYREDVGRFRVSAGGRFVGTAEPARRLYSTQDSPTTEAGILTVGLSQIYVSLGGPEEGAGLTARLYHKPLVLLIWVGAVVMAVGGALSLLDRRLRIGAPQPARAAPARRAA